MDTFFQYIPICEDFWSQLLSVSSSCKGKFKNLNHLCKTYATIYLHYINSELWHVSWIAHTACTKILFADSMIYPSMIGTRYNSIFAMNVLIHDMYDIKSSNLSNKNFHQIQSSLRIFNITHLLYCKYIYPILKCHTI